MPKIQPGKLPQPIHIPKGQPPKEDSRLLFSFKHLDLTSVKFRVADCRDGYLHRFLGRTKDLCGMTPKEFKGPQNKALRIHPIRWDETSEPLGFASLNSQLQDKEAWQFMITANEHGRVHGFLIDDTFYVVWIDPNHALYPKK